MPIFLDGQRFEFEAADLPILISGREGSGASLFGIVVIAELLKRGNKIVFFSAYPMAKDDLRRLTTDNERKEAVIIESGEEDALIKALDGFGEAKDHIIFVKNIENYSERLFAKIKDFDRMIISGDLDKCRFAERLKEIQFAAEIFFTPSERYPKKDLPSLQKYQGYLSGPRQSGVIMISD